MYGASLTVGVTITDLDRAQLEILFDSLGVALIERQGKGSSLLDHSVSLDLKQARLEIAVTTSGKSQREAQALADFYVHDVLTATGGVFAPRTDESEPEWASHATPFVADVTSRELVAV